MLKQILAERKAETDKNAAVAQVQQQAREELFARFKKFIDEEDFTGINLLGDYGRPVPMEPIKNDGCSAVLKLGSRIIPQELVCCTILVEGFPSLKVGIASHYPFESAPHLYFGANPEQAAAEFLKALAKHIVQ